MKRKEKAESHAHKFSISLIKCMDLKKKKKHKKNAETAPVVSQLLKSNATTKHIHYSSRKTESKL